MKKLVRQVFNQVSIFSFAFILFPAAVSASNDSSGFSFASGSLLFRPLVANTIEPRVGIQTHFNDNRLRLDIGNSVDLIRYTPEIQSYLLTIGADFFTFTQLKGESNFHFPVDAVDYVFGFNLNYREAYPFGLLTGRFRLSHISAHFVDGHWDSALNIWKDGRDPVVYSREFLDLAVSIEPSSFHGSTRLYAGVNYLFHVDPKNLPRFSGLFGGEYHIEMYPALHFFTAYQATALKVAQLSLRHDLVSGMKIGNWNGRGLQIFLRFFSGNSIHGEYFDFVETYTAMGFLIDF